MIPYDYITEWRDQTMSNSVTDRNDLLHHTQLETAIAKLMIYLCPTVVPMTN